MVFRGWEPYIPETVGNLQIIETFCSVEAELLSYLHLIFHCKKMENWAEWLVDNAALFSCQLCKANVELGDATEHFQPAHGLSVQEYFAKKLRNIHRCRYCTYGKSNYPLKTQHNCQRVTFLAEMDLEHCGNSKWRFFLHCYEHLTGIYEDRLAADHLLANTTEPRGDMLRGCTYGAGCKESKIL